MTRITNQCTTIEKRCLPRGTGAITGIPNIVERISRQLIVIAGAEPELDRILILRSFVGI